MLDHVDVYIAQLTKESIRIADAGDRMYATA